MKMGEMLVELLRGRRRVLGTGLMNEWWEGLLGADEQLRVQYRVGDPEARNEGGCWRWGVKRAQGEGGWCGDVKGKGGRDVRQALDVGVRSVAVAFWNLGAQTRSYPAVVPRNLYGASGDLI